ncbi:hypothetical protein SBY92_003529 [Candida maltosa Xu316]|uniref:Uncharacterized protein n=1 Tax=Candida maltosa (strain Xu316) TaxID=1245528 RepID=M3K4Z5_CANMX|nr:hypothetical protein G210_4602 [Candida maltosa Xu316]
MERTTSRESTHTLTDPPDNNNNHLSHDNESLFSQDTLINPTITIMNQNISNYTRIHSLPLVSNFLHTGVNLYKSWDDVVNNKDPILTRTSSKNIISSLIQFKAMPFVTIYDSKKQEFCTVDFKIHSNHITYYTLRFPSLDGFTLYLVNNNSSNPTVDFEYMGSLFRIRGVTGTTTMLGTSPEIKVYVMSPESRENMLTFGVGDDERQLKRKLKIDNRLSRLIHNQDQRKINDLLNNEKPLVNIPIARYFDQGDVKMKTGDGQKKKNVIKHGTIKIFDHGLTTTTTTENNDVSDDMLVLCCVLLVLREQEYRKFKSS